ncbi:WD40 repeat-like protein [Cylindrobasidium torrendii FP15055 ss-10]|uniref:WD40 repeat-like protein n=1 Tax=Cylindrobasidium torrendii FP15055 ss-10 TaxID=1314674 RepID=A0A0D7AT80_9AGAR|nr:WD40 repeat-like protein [Cylindrobasidium torrendii FP15055 ss-10]
MASTSSAGPSVAVVFTTKTPYPLPTQKFMIPASWKRFHLSQLVNKALGLSTPIPFDFLVKEQVLAASLGEWCAENDAHEETLEIEYIESILPPQKMAEIPHEEWVSSVSCKLQGLFLTASYDGTVRAFDYSQNETIKIGLHAAPITSLCVVSSNEDNHLIATASHDLTAQLSHISTDGSSSKSLATLHLHSEPLSSVCANVTGSHVLTSSWDSIIGIWDTKIPSVDEVADEPLGQDRKKRRKMETDKPKRKGPVGVLKSHTGRVSRVLFGSAKQAYSCGFDSTVRLWDLDNEVCTNTITVSERPFVDLALTCDGALALAASTDRSVFMYDLRAAAATGTPSLMHASTPSCIATSPSSTTQLVTGAYDGMVRMWDIRSTKTAMSTFKPWDGRKKILSLDWQRGLVCIGGEGGVEIWKAAEESTSV